MLYERYRVLRVLSIRLGNSLLNEPQEKRKEGSNMSLARAPEESRLRIELPEMKLPKFSDNHLKGFTFSNRFLSTIHENTNRQ